MNSFYRSVYNEIRRSTEAYPKSSEGFPQIPCQKRDSSRENNQELQKTLQMLLDVKTRWNSTEAMLERFIQTFDCLKEALDEIGLPDLILPNDIEVAKSVHEALQPIRLASEALGRRDATLLSAEGSLSFMYAKLKKNSTSVGRDLYLSITERINEHRRDPGISRDSV